MLFKFFVNLRIQIINNFQLLNMISPAQTLTQCYTKQNNGQNKLDNLAPAAIRCLTCGQFYEAEKIQQHLISHVNPKHIKTSPIGKSQTPIKQNLARLLEDPQKVQDIQVRSFLASDLPCIQVQRKKAVVPKGLYAQLQNVIRKDINKCFPDQLIQPSTDGSEDLIDREFRDPSIQIKQKVSLNRRQQSVHKKQLNVYLNQSKGIPNVDIMSSKRKIIPDSETEQSDGYKVVQAPIDVPNIPIQQNRRTYQIQSDRKNPIRNLKISTFSRKPQQSTILDSSRRGDPGNLACPHCQGFYCHYCKSSIPPIYRPVPDSEGNYHFHPHQHQRTIQFMQNHYYPLQQPRVCTVCTKNMYNSRNTNTHFLATQSRLTNEHNKTPSPFEKSPQQLQKQ